MTGAQRVGANPVEQLEVLDHVRVAVALAQSVVVFVHSEASEVERFTVDEEIGAADFHRADTKVLGVLIKHFTIVGDHRYHEVVETAHSRGPHHGVIDDDRGIRPATFRNGFAGVLVDDGHTNFITCCHRRLGELDAPVDCGTVLVVGGGDSDIVHVARAARDEVHAAVQAGVVV